jgi:hypothetical protein
MADRRDLEDARWQRLANLSIEIRMLKARVQTAFEEHESGAAGWHVRDANLPGTLRDPCCPHCGHTAGLARVPREYRRQSTLVRCFACQRDSAAFDWTAQPAPALETGRNAPDRRPPR